jgi:excisionase family DNA binding protein
MKDESRLALRLNEAAKAIGVSARTLWEMARAGQVPHVRIPRGGKDLLLFPVAELQVWLRSEARGQQGGRGDE